MISEFNGCVAGDYGYNQQETLNQPESGSNQGGSMKIPLSMQVVLFSFKYLKKPIIAPRVFL